MIASAAAKPRGRANLTADGGDAAGAGSAARRFPSSSLLAGFYKASLIHQTT
jgi:hypothetical protein